MIKERKTSLRQEGSLRCPNFNCGFTILSYVRYNKMVQDSTVKTQLIVC